MPISDRHFIICLGRQVGSGGLTIARHLANVLDCKVYDKELINMAAKESGFAEQFFEKNEVMSSVRWPTRKIVFS